MKRLISFMLAFAMILGMIPVGEMTAFAADEASINRIIINKTYESIEDYGTFFITITGTNLDKAEIKIIEAGGGLKDPIKSPNSGKYVAQYSYPASSIGQKLFIDGKQYSLGEEEIPKITGRDGDTTRVVNSGSDITLTGEKINNLKDGNMNIKAYFSQSSSKEPVKDAEVQDGKIVKNVGTVLGSHSLVFEKDTTINGVEIEIEHTYKSIVIVRGDLKVEGEVSVFPSQGPRDSTVTLTANKIESNVSVFLMKKGEEHKYTKENMAPNDSVTHIQEGQKEKVKFKVPKALANGLHEIVLTNKVDLNKSIDDQISKYRVLGNKVTEDGQEVLKRINFNVVDGSSGVDLKNINPNYSSIKGVDAEIEGRNILRISPNLYKGEALKQEDIDISDNKKMVVSFGVGEYNGEEVKSIKRTITVQIGVPATFKNHDISGSVYDYLEIRVPENDNLDKPVKDVIVFITNEIEFLDGQKVIVTEEDILENGFTYKPIDFEPKVKEVDPKMIPVDSTNKVTKEFVISITGENFLKYGYVKDNTLETKEPLVSVENQANSDEWFDNESIRIYDKNGNILEEKEGEQFGSVIKIKIKDEAVVPEGIIGSIQKLRVQNPLAIESEGDMGSYATGEVKFVKVETDKTPIITSVDPNIVTTTGKEVITIKGSNFGQNVNVYLDGEKITGAKRNGTGTELTFTAPSKPEGIYQIIVQNEEGGIDTFDSFVYVKTYTDIKLTDFVPKKGTANSLVTVSGENFVRPNPVVKDLSGMGIYKLIGTRVFLGDKDVNSYQKENGIPALKPYISPKDENGKLIPIIQIEDNKLKASDYYHSIILQEGLDTNPDYYSIYFDTINGNYKLTNGDKEEYTLSIDSKATEDNTDDVITGRKDGKEYELNIGEDKVTIKGIGGESDKELEIKTLYSTTNIGGVEIITGNRVKVKNGRELIFTVPPMPREGYYDLTVVNPDTKKDSKKDKDGFYYSFQPEYNPIIRDITPKEGSTEGGYFIDIIGEGFLDRGGDTKTSVTIGTVKVDSKEVTVSPDGNKMTVKVPKYPGNLEDETDMDRKTVGVVVVNPDGGSASREDGFTYIIPISHPKIDKLILSDGSAAGGESVTIEGSEFRYFEPFKDTNNNGKRDIGESFTDKNKNGIWDDFRFWNPPGSSSNYETILGQVNEAQNPQEEYEKLIKPVLPKVYFGAQEAKILSFTASMIEVETPKAQDGEVDVYLVNNDYGTSNKLKYTYKASKPIIKTIVPNVGKKQGDDKVEILGESFYNSSLLVIDKDSDNDGKNNDTKTQDMPLVQFGDFEKDTKISNKSIPIDAPKSSGKIRDKKSTVEVGDLTVDYDVSGTKRNLSFNITKGTGTNKVEYHFTYEDYKDNEVFFPTNLLKDVDGNNYSENDIVPEYVRVKLEIIEGANSTTRLRVDRGFSPQTELLNSGQISLKTPAYYTVGKTKVTIINPDGGTAEGEFEYKNPDSNPTIVKVLKDGEEGTSEEYNEDGILKERKIVRVNIDGGNTIDILGTDFRKPVKIKIGDTDPITTGIEYDPSNEPISQKMTFKMPKVDEKYVNEIHRIVIENEDGGTATSDEANPPIYIQFIKSETPNLEITSIDPTAGPTKGGTKVVISGKDFRKTMDGFEDEKLKVYFGEGKDQVKVPDVNIDWDNTNIGKITLTTPQHTPGVVSIKVINPDGSIAELKDAFTFVSNPKITNVVDPENGDVPINTISIEGDQTIKIQGNDFIEGAKVIFNPVLKKLSENPNATGEKISIDGKDYILESGTEGVDVEVIDSANIKVKTPSGKVGTGGIIVINPDSASTPKYDIEYGIPEITYPQEVRATLIKDEYIRINWNNVTDKATEDDGKTVQYEVYVIEDGEGMEFVGSTGNTGFIFKDIEPKTKYEFLVRAIGKYGSSKPIDESISNWVKTGKYAGQEDVDGELGEETTIDKIGNTGNVVIGRDEFDGKYEFVIDLTRGTLSGSKEVVVSIPAEVISSGYNKQIKIEGNDYTLNFSPSVFMNSKISSNRSRNDAGVKFKVSPVNRGFNLETNNGQTIISNQYSLDGEVFIGSNIDNIESLNGNMKFTLDYDTQMVKTRRIKTINLVKYDEYNRKFKNIYGNSSYGTSSGEIDELGTYTITGSRR